MKFLKRDEKGKMAVGSIIGVVIAILVALVLIPIIIVQVSAAKNATTGTSDTLLDLVPVFFVLGIAILAVMWVVAQTKGQ